MPATNGTTNGKAPVPEFVVPKEMKAIRYNKIKDFSLVTMPVPEPKGHEILIKGTASRPGRSLIMTFAQSSLAESVELISIFIMEISTQQCLL